MNDEGTTGELQRREKRALQEESTRPGPVFRPDVDILEQSDAFVVYADLPGADESTVQVRLEKGTLHLDAAPAAPPEAGWSLLHGEYRVGGYHREFRISEHVDAAGVTAHLRNGVLELRLPKSAPARTRTIPVQAR
jgi:HSP20 family protein